VDLVVSASTNTTDGIDLSELYIVENNLADIMTESFGTCEYYSTDSQVAGVNAVAEQAAAQGITYFVSAGDDGAEGCDDQNSETVATGPLSVNVLASTPYTVALVRRAGRMRAFGREVAG
jgi:subtilase family serine protease